MRRSGRIVSITTHALVVLALGFVVSIAANSVPGRGAEEPILDVAWHPGIDVTTVLTWLVLMAAVTGAIIMALSARELRPPREQKRRGIMVLVLGIIVFALIARYLRSIADTLLPESSEVIGEVGEGPIAESTGTRDSARTPKTITVVPLHISNDSAVRCCSSAWANMLLKNSP